LDGYVQKIIVGVDGSAASRAGLEWCANHADRDDEVVAICGMSEAGEFVLSLPGFDQTASPQQIQERFRSIWCAPLERAGLTWRAEFVHHAHPSALAEAIDNEHPDLVVIGKPDHTAFDVLLRGKLQHALRHAHCPVLVVPEAA
jgi:nucleotide-binding universal stress UspA family protein